MPDQAPLPKGGFAGTNALHFLLAAVSFTGVIMLHDQLYLLSPLVPIPSDAHGARVQFRSFYTLSWMLMGISALSLALTLLLGPTRRWALWPLLGCLAGAVATLLLIPFYL